LIEDNLTGGAAAGTWKGRVRKSAAFPLGGKETPEIGIFGKTAFKSGWERSRMGGLRSSALGFWSLKIVSLNIRFFGL
jgi:hypothetical protein